jgi:hypothetical protein
VIPPALLFVCALVKLEIEFHFMPRQAWTVILLFVLPTVAEMTDVVPLHPAFFIKMGSHKLFCWAGLEL